MKTSLLSVVCLLLALNCFSQTKSSSQSKKTPAAKTTTQKKGSAAPAADSTKAKAAPLNQPKVVAKSKSTNGFTFEVESSDVFYLIPADKNGFITLYSDEEKKKGMVSWNVSLYDTTMKKGWETTVETKKNMKLLDYKKNGNILYVIYALQGIGNVGHSIDDKAIDKDRISVLQIALDSRQAKMVDASAPTNFIYAGMDILGKDEIIINGLNNLTSNGLFFCKEYCDLLLCCIPSFAGFLYIKDQPFAYSINLSSGKKTIYPMNMKGNNYVSNIWTSNDKSSYFVCTNKPKPKITNVYMYNIKGGNVKSTQNLNLGQGTVLKDVSGYDIDENKTLILGIYGEDPKKIGFFHKLMIIIAANFNAINSDVSDGICINELEGSKIVKTKKFDFSKIKDLTEVRKKATCVADACLGYSMHINKVINNGADGFVVIAEGYTRAYDTYVTCTTDSHGSTHCETHYIFKGYEDIAGIIMQLDDGGNLRWGQAFPISQSLSSSLRNKISVKKVSDDEYSLVYPFKDGIYSRTYSGNSISPETKLDEILAHIKLSDEKIKSNSMNTEPWYDNNVLVYGTEKVKKKGHGTHYKVYVNQFSYDN